MNRRKLAGYGTLAVIAAALMGSISVGTPRAVACESLYSQGVWCGSPCANDYVDYAQDSETGGESSTVRIVSVCSGCCTSPHCSGSPHQYNYTLNGSCGYTSGGGDPWNDGDGGYGS